MKNTQKIIRPQVHRREILKDEVDRINKNNSNGCKNDKDKKDTITLVGTYIKTIKYGDTKRCLFKDIMSQNHRDVTDHILIDVNEFKDWINEEEFMSGDWVEFTGKLYKYYKKDRKTGNLIEDYGIKNISYADIIERKIQIGQSNNGLKCEICLLSEHCDNVNCMMC